MSSKNWRDSGAFSSYKFSTGNRKMRLKTENELIDKNQKFISYSMGSSSVNSFLSRTDTLPVWKGKEPKKKTIDCMNLDLFTENITISRSCHIFIITNHTLTHIPFGWFCGYCNDVCSCHIPYANDGTMFEKQPRFWYCKIGHVGIKQHPWCKAYSVILALNGGERVRWEKSRDSNLFSWYRSIKHLHVYCMIFCFLLVCWNVLFAIGMELIACNA